MPVLMAGVFNDLGHQYDLYFLFVVKLSIIRWNVIFLVRLITGFNPAEINHFRSHRYYQSICSILIGVLFLPINQWNQNPINSKKENEYHLMLYFKILSFMKYHFNYKVNIKVLASHEYMNFLSVTFLI